MRDARLIRERSPLWRLAVVTLRTLRLALLLGTAFVFGRWSVAEWPLAPVPDALPVTGGVHPAPQLTAEFGRAYGQVVGPSDDSGNLSGRATAKATARGAGRPLRSPALVAPGGPMALADGLLPSEVGTARSGEYSVVIGTFGSKAEAQAFCQQLTRRGFHPFVARVEADAAAGPIFRVQLGRFVSERAAADYRSRLSRVDVQSSVVVMPP